MKLDLCQTCKKGTMHREYVVNEMILWMCSTVSCERTEFEKLRDLDDEGWAWVRKYYQET